MQSPSPPPLHVAWSIWGLGALFYLMGFFQRVAPAVLTEELMREFGIGAAAMGNLSALYFYSYVAMQIPTGILADAWGPRRLLTLGSLTAGLGTVCFAIAPVFAVAGLGRFLIGGSVAVAFVGLLKVANSWFPPRHYALTAGVALFFGIIGAVAAGPPLRILVVAFGWRSVLLASALVTVGISAAIWIFLRDHPHERGYADPAPRERQSPHPGRSSVAGSIVDVFRYRNTWLLFLLAGGVVGPVLTFSGLWGVPFFTTHYGFSTERASVLTTTLLVAWAVGGPFFGWLSDRIGRRKPIYVAGGAAALAGWCVILFVEALPLPVLLALLTTTGFSAGCMIVSFAFAKESVPDALSGTVSGVVNMGVMLGPTLLQPAVGWILDRNWTGATSAGVRIYSLSTYRSGFLLMVAWAVLALVLLLFTRETRCRQVV